MNTRAVFNRYALALLAVLLIFGLRWLLEPALNKQLPLHLFLLAVLAAGRYGGRGPATAALFGGLLLGAFFLGPTGGAALLGSADAVVIISYLVTGGLLVWLVGRAQDDRLALGAETIRRHAAEREAWRHGEQLRVAMLSIGEGVIEVDRQGRVRAMNITAEDLTGWTMEEARGRKLNEVFRLVDEGTKVPLRDPTARALEEGSITGVPGPALLVAKDGRERSVGSSAAPLRDPEGAIRGSVLVFRDLSDRRAQERRLEQNGRDKESFLATLAHELRNPLAPLVSGLELLETKALLDHDVAEVHPILARQTQKLVRLVDGLMDLNRLERGAVTLHTTTIDLRDVVNDAVEASKTLAGTTGQHLRAQKPLVPVYVNGDRQRLTQVMTHLLDNACKYTPDHGSIKVALEITDEEAIIRVRDNGHGIPEDQLADLFGPHPQGGRGRTNANAGMGVGLAMAQRLVEMHHGTIAVRSVEGQGSEFTVTLPLVQSPGSAQEQVLDLPAGKEDIGHWRMMVVDDDRDAAALLGTLLTRAGHTVLTVNSGVEALDALSRFAPQVVIMDIGMPVLDGYETAMRMRVQPWGRSAVLIALSGWGQETDMERSKEAGFDHHLVKPVEQDAVEELIAQLPDKAAPKRPFPDF